MGRPRKPRPRSQDYLGRQRQADELTMGDWLAQEAQKDMLRFITCGSVDDGKSTLIGRLLLESQQIFDDQLAAL